MPVVGDHMAPLGAVQSGGAILKNANLWTTGAFVSA